MVPILSLDFSLDEIRGRVTTSLWQRFSNIFMLISLGNSHAPKLSAVDNLHRFIDLPRVWFNALLTIATVGMDCNTTDDSPKPSQRLGGPHIGQLALVRHLSVSSQFSSKCLAECSCLEGATNISSYTMFGRFSDSLPILVFPLQLSVYRW
jgi:hypothetical protein